MDATQFKVGYACGSNERVLVHNADDNKNSLKTGPDDSKNSGITAYFIKYYLILTASGSASQPVYVVADVDMQNNEIDVYKVPGLGITTDPGNNGFIVYCKSRSCNEAFSQ